MDKNTLLKKWLNNELTAPEKELFEQQDDFKLNEAIVKEAKRFKASNNRSKEDFEALKARLEKESKTKSSSYLWIKIAAIVIVALGAFFVFTNDPLTQIQTGISERQEIVLPDQSIVTLNAVSSLSFNEGNWNKDRTIQLEGEAYFEVNKGSTFMVETEQGIIKVLGTKFNVKKRSTSLQVICFEGSVSVQTPFDAIVLKPGDEVNITKDSFIASQSDALEPQWKAGISIFENSPLSQVFDEITLYYDISIDYSNIDPERRFSGSFTHKNLQEALKSITIPMGLRFSNQSEQKIIIYE